MIKAFNQKNWPIFIEVLSDKHWTLEAIRVFVHFAIPFILEL